MELPSLLLELPNEPLRWQRLQELYKSLHNVRDTKSLLSILLEIFNCVRNRTQCRDSSDVLEERKLFSGLEIFLNDIASVQEKSSFFQAILPEIANFASLLDVNIASVNPHHSFGHKDARMVLSNNSIASLLASSFLCAIPSSTERFDFLELYSEIQSVEFKGKAVEKLQTVFQYFKSIASSKIDMTEEVIFEIQVTESPSLPSMEFWETSDAILCPLVVEHGKQKHDTLTSFEKDNRVIDTSIEAHVAMWCVDRLKENEVLIIKHGNDANRHVERLVIDAIPSDNEETLPTEQILKYLNKALMCFDNQGSLCDLVDCVDNDNVQNELTDEEDGIQYVTDEEIYGEEKPKHVKVTDINDNFTILGIDTFCRSLVGQAYDQARSEIDMTSENHRDMFEDLMKKSLHELFHKTPEKEKRYSDNIIHSPLLPKCLLHFHSNNDVSASPLVPSTPPSSPAVKQGLVVNGRQSPPYSSSPLVNELTLGTKSFADSLAEALMSSVLLSSSIATSIATEALDPLSITSVTMGMFQKSPYKILDGQNGPSRISANKLDENLHINTSFEVLASQKFNSDLIDVSSDALSIDSDDDHEARRQSLNELALNLFENFASKLSGSIIQTATREIIGDVALECVTEEREDVIKTNESEANKACYVDLNKGDSHESSSYKSLSDSDSDRDEHWYDMDLDRELEEKLYELDLIDNEDLSISCQRSLSDMADDMIAVVLRSAVNEAAIDVDPTLSGRPTDTLALDAEELEDGISYEDDLTHESHFLENTDPQVDVPPESVNHNPNNGVIEVFASDVCVNIVHDVLEGFRHNTDMLTSLSQNVGDIHSTSTEIDKSDDVGDVSNVSSMDQTAELIQYVEVLTEQVIEASVDIASAVERDGSVRPVVFSIWSSGHGVVDVQMEAILQWLAASAVRCPAVVFHDIWDTRLDKFSTVHRKLRDNHYRVRDVLEIVLRYTQSEERDMSCDLFEFFLESLS